MDVLNKKGIIVHQSVEEKYNTVFEKYTKRVLELPKQKISIKVDESVCSFNNATPQFDQEPHDNVASLINSRNLPVANNVPS